MYESIETQIRKSLWELAMSQMSLDGFRDWFVPISWNIEKTREPEAIELAHYIDGVLAEASSGAWTEDELREELARPFEAELSALDVVGDPSPFPISQFVAPFANNSAVAA
jgi:hypothetical protein